MRVRVMAGLWISEAIKFMPKQILSFLPGYCWDGSNLRSTGLAMEPSQHVDQQTGEVIYYCKPLFAFNSKIGLYIKRSGLKRAIEEGHR